MTLPGDSRTIVKWAAALILVVVLLCVWSAWKKSEALKSESNSAMQSQGQAGETTGTCSAAGRWESLAEHLDEASGPVMSVVNRLNGMTTSADLARAHAASLRSQASGTYQTSREVSSANFGLTRVSPTPTC